MNFLKIHFKEISAYKVTVKRKHFLKSIYRHKNTKIQKYFARKNDEELSDNVIKLAFFRACRFRWIIVQKISMIFITDF